MQDHNAGLPSSVQDGECFGRLVVAPRVTLGLTWAAAHIEPDTTLMVWKLDKDFKNVLSVHAASVGRRFENRLAAGKGASADWKHQNSFKDFCIFKLSVFEIPQYLRQLFSM